MKNKFKIKKLESNLLLFDNKIKKNNTISLIYYELNKDLVDVTSITGTCIKFKSKGINSKIVIKNNFKNLKFIQSFYLNSKNIVDIKI